MPPHLVLLLFLGLGGLLPAASAADEQFVFDGFKGANLSFDGMATVTPDGLLMLTIGTNQLKGHAFYPAPLRFRRAPNGTAMQSFSTAFVIGIIGAFEDLSSHGMAFVVAKSSNFTSALPGQFTRLQGDFVEREASLVLRLGLLCSHPLPGARPGMRQIVQYLDGDAPLPELSPTYQGLNMMSLMQDQGFDPYIMSFPMTSTGISTISDR